MTQGNLAEIKLCTFNVKLRTVLSLPAFDTILRAGSLRCSWVCHKIFGIKDCLRRRLQVGSLRKQRPLFASFPALAFAQNCQERQEAAGVLEQLVR